MHWIVFFAFLVAPFAHLAQASQEFSHKSNENSPSSSTRSSQGSDGDRHLVSSHPQEPLSENIFILLDQGKKTPFQVAEAIQGLEKDSLIQQLNELFDTERHADANDFLKNLLYFGVVTLGEGEIVDADSEKLSTIFKEQGFYTVRKAKEEREKSAKDTMSLSH